MHHDGPDLEALAASTFSSLTSIWDDIGCPEAERDAFISKLSDDVAAIYRSRVDCQEARRRDMIAEAAELETTIENMHHAMEQPPVVPSRDGRSLQAFRDLLDADRAMLQESWDARQTELKKLQSVLSSLCNDLGEAIETLFEGIGDKMSLQRIAAFHAEIDRVAAIKQSREEEITALCDAIMELWAEMAFDPMDDFEACVPMRGKGMGWSSAVVGALKAKVASLSEEKAIREDRIAVIGKEITALWKRLATPEAEQTGFLEAHAGIGDQVQAACEAYLAAKKAEFSVRLVDLIGSARGVIAGVWDEMKAGPQQRAAMFPGFFSPPSEFSDALFVAHEEYTAHVQTQLEGMMPLLKATEKRIALLEDKVEYEHIISDPARLLAKGSSAARLREEKLERRVKKELPVVSKRLRAQITEWETAHGTEFVIGDVRYVTTMDAEEEADAKASDDARAARAAAKQLHAGGSDAGSSAAPSASSSSGSAVGASSSSSSSSVSGGGGVGAPSSAAPRSISAGSAGSTSGRASLYVKPSAAGAMAMKRGGTAASSAASTTTAVPSAPGHHGARKPSATTGTGIEKAAAAAAGHGGGKPPAAAPATSSVSSTTLDEPVCAIGSENEHPTTHAPRAAAAAAGGALTTSSLNALGEGAGGVHKQQGATGNKAGGMTVVSVGAIAVSDASKAAAASKMAAL